MSKISLYFTIDDVKSFIEQGLSYEEISSQVKNLHPSAGGLLERSIRRFCKKRTQHKQKLHNVRRIKKGSNSSKHLASTIFFLSRSHSKSSVLQVFGKNLEYIMRKI